MTNPETDPHADGPAQSPDLRIITDLAELVPDPVPARMRSSVLASIREHTARRPVPLPTQVPEAAAPYAAQIAELDTLLKGLDGPQWALRVIHDWNIAAVLGHLFAVDALLAEALGVPVTPAAGTGTDVAERTRTAHRAFADRPVSEVHTAWRGQAIAVLSHIIATPERTGRQVDWFGLELPIAAVLLDRAAETWGHSADIRTALGLPPRDPGPADLAKIAQGGARMLPRFWPASAERGGRVRLSLQGEYPSDWVLDPGHGEARRLPAGAPDRSEVEAAITIGVLDFCYLLLGRRTPDDVSHQGAGDPILVRATLAAAAGYARL
jgi:uncharacterized protein (TIGR03083 family)